jgi:hypothetical protein
MLKEFLHFANEQVEGLEGFTASSNAFGIFFMVLFLFHSPLRIH